MRANSAETDIYMKKKHRVKLFQLILIISIIFVMLGGITLHLSSSYIKNQLLLANENMAIDFAELTRLNFSITDEEFDYMKSISFNEMEVDPINMRLMEVVNNADLRTDITNVYVITELKDNEIKYTTDAETAEFFGYEVGTPLNGVWLLNGKFENGNFIAAQRDDIYRYTALTEAQETCLHGNCSYAEFSSDAWGNFITGYTPLYTTEGHFVGLLGIDMSPDKFQASAQRVIAVMITGFAVIGFITICLFLYFYFRFVKAKEGQLYFDFYSRMSHDMRTPMNGILGMTALSKEENDIDVLHENIKKIDESGKYMLGLINDTLDVQKIDAGKLQLNAAPECCYDLFCNIVTMVRTNAEKKNITFHIKDTGFDNQTLCYVDALRLEQIFINLLSNAIKFTPEGGDVFFSGECIGQTDDTIHTKFIISDSGIGMSESFIHDKLFHPFEQEQASTTAKYGGSGLGLSIVKSLILLMNGQIDVNSKLGSGTTFTVYLDFKIVKEQIQTYNGQKILSNEEIISKLNGRTILLCEDHPLNAEIASKLLQTYGCTTTIAHDGQEGLQCFTNSPHGFYDVILMDIRMPVMDGLECTAAIRKSNHPDAMTIPIIAMTANAYDEDIRNCKAAGMNAHVAKPFNPEHLARTIAEFF